MGKFYKYIFTIPRRDIRNSNITAFIILQIRCVRYKRDVYRRFLQNENHSIRNVIALFLVNVFTQLAVR